MITQDERWEKNYQQIIAYVNTFKRWPSKHRIEDHRMLNWLKYNRKLVAENRLEPERKKRFEALLSMAAQYHKVNQHAYVQTKNNETDLFNNTTTTN